MEQIYIYGDSLLKATVPDESFRYHFHLPEVMNWYRASAWRLRTARRWARRRQKGCSSWSTTWPRYGRALCSRGLRRQ